MSWFGDNVIFSGIIVSATLNSFLRTVKWGLSSLFFSNNIIRASFVGALLFHVCFFILKGRKKPPFHWSGKDFSLAALSQSSIAAAQSKTSTRALVSVATCQCHAAKQTVCPSLCPSSQLWESALGLCTECSAQCRSLYFTPQVWFPLRRL